MAPSASATTTSIQVALRIRPITKQDAISIPPRFQRTVIHAVSNQVVAVDLTSQAQSASSGAQGSAVISTPSKKQTFAFDQVLGLETTQYELFQATASPLISRFLEGFNCTILAYGQTSSGKTYSMTGVDLDADPADPYNGMGIMPRSISEIFNRAAGLKEEKGGALQFSIKGSFIELYNEELIDLLSYDDTGGGRREVQIREDKHGNIIWDGLREVSVRNAHEVMNLIRQGTSIRRTNETDMNAQSSRSHAIFSLTLVQKKYTGTTPPRSSTPISSSRSPSRLARPMSHQFNTISNRVSSPTLGRPPTPSFATAMSRGAGLRPSSALGSHSSDGKAKNLDDDGGEWVTVVSKFHFVDLAGSERLKRTAAAGERVKEGISINSGLLALGNVISALGDPSRAKTHTASHVPYRDSKLTRLLQDSIGGNAHTLMVACVSPAEWNANETVNTLKYANRARNIKNRAVITEKEEGWDDLEWLQNNVTRLRKELKALKEGGSLSIRSIEHADHEGASKRVLEQMVELQTNYEEMRGKYVDRTEELTRLRRELAEKHRSSSAGNISGTAKYEEIVGPVIEEYEKTISAMEAELSLNRAALRHTNDLVEEKEEEFMQLSERHVATELYVEELKSRVSKLAEREASTEAYIRDLEEKIKQQEDTSLSSNESVSDLKKEISRLKELDDRASSYVSELEIRLARSDESILKLRTQVEQLEKQSEARRAEAEDLRTRLNGIMNDGESWRSDLENREKKMQDLEAKMEEWERRRREVSEDRSRLGDIKEEVLQARRSLELDLAQAREASNHSDDNQESEEKDSLEQQLKSLQETHAATLADLSSVTTKYRDALREISELAAQINEIKLGSPSERSDSPEGISETSDSGHRRNSDAHVLELVNSNAAHPFFGHATSAVSLHTRSRSQSQSLSQELYSAQSRMRSSPETSETSYINGYGLWRSHRSIPNMSISLPIGAGTERSVASLEKEIMRLQEVLKEREAEISHLETSLKEKESTVPKVNDTETLNGHATGGSDLSPRIMDQFDAVRRSMETRSRPTDVSPDDEPIGRLNELLLSMAQKEAQHKEQVDSLMDELAQVHRQHDELTRLSRDQTMNMSNELEALRGKHGDILSELESLAQRETELINERRVLEEKHEEVHQKLQAEHEQALRGKQMEVDKLLEELSSKYEQEARDKQSQVEALLEDMKSTSVVALEKLKAEHAKSSEDLLKRLAETSRALSRSQEGHEVAFGKLAEEHEEELRELREEVHRALNDAGNAHKADLAKIAAEHQAALKEKEDMLSRTEEEYYTALSKLRADHTELIAKKEVEHAAAIERLKEEHAGELKMAELAREGSLTESQSHQAEVLKKLQSEHASAIEKKEATFMEDLRKLQEEHAAALEKKQADHAASVERMKSRHSAKLAELEESKNLEIEALQQTLITTHQQLESSRSILFEKEEVLQNLHQEHAVAIQNLGDSHEDTIARLKREHENSEQQKSVSHGEALERLKQEHAETVAQLEKRRDDVLAEFKSNLVSMQEALKEQEASKRAVDVALSDAHAAQAAHQEVVDVLAKEKDEEVARLRAQHEKAVAALENTRIAASDQHQNDLENARTQCEALIAAEKEQFKRSLAETEAEFAKERESNRKGRELLLQEIASHKAAAEEIVNTLNTLEQIRQAHEKSIKDKDLIVSSLRDDLDTVHTECQQHETDMEEMRKELDTLRRDQEKLLEEAAKNDKSSELEKSLQLLADAQAELQKMKEQRDQLQAERTKQDSLLRDLQTQLSRHSHPEALLRSASDRISTYSRANGISKLPPLSPPPSGPPPPAPMSISPISPLHTASSDATNVSLAQSVSAQVPDSPGGTTLASIASPSTLSADAKLLGQIEEKTRQIGEQEQMIKTLNKQLSHCESDLQAHMDLVSTLESSLGDSEKNLRKARMQATELVRERDTLSGQTERLRTELEEARREVTIVRRSVIEEKQSLESRLDEERRAKERARQQLDMRVEELQKRKSKFVCL